MHPLQILVDARGTQEGYKHHRERGLGHYAVNLLARLPGAAGNHSLTYLLERGLPKPAETTQSAVSLLESPSPASRSNLGRYLSAQRTLPPLLRSQRWDVAHFLFQQDAPLYSSIPIVLTIPDIVPYAAGDVYGWKRGLKYRLLKIPDAMAARRAAAVIAISEHTRTDVIRHLGLTPDRVKVVYLGVGKEFFEPVREEAQLRVRSRYGLPSRFLLYIGGIDPRKNVQSLVRALGRLWEEPASRIPLVLAGKLSSQRDYPALSELIRKLGLEEAVHAPGYVADEDLPSLFGAASLFVFPSLYEGFGLPLLQAMAAGCPVVTSKRTSIPEIAGEAALYVDPLNPDEIARGVRALLEESGTASDLVTKGRARARGFTWERTASETMRIYEEVAAGAQTSRR